jgi:hypothetical protein
VKKQPSQSWVILGIGALGDTLRLHFYGWLTFFSGCDGVGKARESAVSNWSG